MKTNSIGYDLSLPMSMSTTNKIKINISASDVAAAISIHPYKSSQEVLDKILSKYFPQKGVRTQEQKAVALLNESELGTRLAKEISKDAGNVATSVLLDKVAQSVDALKDTFQGEDKKMVNEYLKGKANKTHGIRCEDKTAQNLVDQGYCTKLVMDHKYHTCLVLETDRLTFILIGKIDRLDMESDGSKTLIEIKNRVKGLFYELKEYEHIQVQTYLELLDLEKGKLIEQYRQDSTVNSIEISRDRSFWNDTIVPGLLEFCKKVEEQAFCE